MENIIDALDKIVNKKSTDHLSFVLDAIYQVSDKEDRDNALIFYYLSKIPVLSVNGMQQLKSIYGKEDLKFPDFLSNDQISSFVDFLLGLIQKIPQFKYVASNVYQICPPSRSKELLLPIIKLSDRYCLEEFVKRGNKIPFDVIANCLIQSQKESRLVACSVFAKDNDFIEFLLKNDDAQNLDLLDDVLAFVSPGSLPNSISFELAKKFVRGDIDIFNNLFIAFASTIPDFEFEIDDIENPSFPSNVIEKSISNKLIFNDLRLELTPKSPQFAVSMFSEHKEKHTEEKVEVKAVESKPKRGFIGSLLSKLWGSNTVSPQSPPQKPANVSNMTEKSKTEDSAVKTTPRVEEKPKDIIPPKKETTPVKTEEKKVVKKETTTVKTEEKKEAVYVKAEEKKVAKSKTVQIKNGEKPVAKSKVAAKAKTISKSKGDADPSMFVSNIGMNKYAFAQSSDDYSDDGDNVGDTDIRDLFITKNKNISKFAASFESSDYSD